MIDRKKEMNESVWLYYKYLSRCTVTQTSDSYNEILRRVHATIVAVEKQ